MSVLLDKAAIGSKYFESNTGSWWVKVEDGWKKEGPTISCTPKALATRDRIHEIIDGVTTTEWHEMGQLNSKDITDEIVTVVNEWIDQVIATVRDENRITVCPQCKELVCDGPPRCSNPDGRPTETTVREKE